MELDAFIGASNNNTPFYPGPPPPRLALLRTGAILLAFLAWPARIRDRMQRSHFIGPRDSDNLPALRPREDCNAVRVFWLGVAEGGCDFAAGGRPDEGCNLGLYVNGREASTGKGVVKVDGAVVGAAPSGEEARLPGAESNGFDGGAVEPPV